MSSTGKKFDTGKPKMGLLDTSWLRGVAEVLTFGAQKYDAHNWRGGIATSRLYDAVQRHLSAWNDREDKDPESGLSHLLHASCGLMFLYWMQANRPELDDRFALTQGTEPQESEFDYIPGCGCVYCIAEEKLKQSAADAAAKGRAP